MLTALGAAWTWYAFRNRGAASGLRGAGLTLLPPAAFLTGTLEMFTEIGGSVVDWATSLVLSPIVWAGHRAGRPLGGAARRLGRSCAGAAGRQLDPGRHAAATGADANGPRCRRSGTGRERAA